LVTRLKAQPEAVRLDSVHRVCVFVSIIQIIQLRLRSSLAAIDFVRFGIVDDSSIHDLEKLKVSPNFHVEDGSDALLFLVDLPNAELLLLADTDERLGVGQISHDVDGLSVNHEPTIELM